MTQNLLDDGCCRVTMSDTGPTGGGEGCSESPHSSNGPTEGTGFGVAGERAMEEERDLRANGKGIKSVSEWCRWEGG